MEVKEEVKRVRWQRNFVHDFWQFLRFYVPPDLPMAADLQDVPPYLIQPLIPTISTGIVSCAQALGVYSTARIVSLTHGN